MIGLDTNVLVRYAAQDDASQSAAADTLIDSLTIESPGFVSTVALVEAVWVLRRLFEADPESISRFVNHLLAASQLVVEHSEAVRNAIDSTAGSPEFNDALLAQLATALGCDYTVTFDRRAAKLPGMRLLGA